MNRELKNGLYHGLAAIVALAPAAAFGGIAAFTFAGFCLGLVRETTEEQLKNGTKLPAAIYDALFSWRDLLGWSIGGFAIGLGAVA